MKKADGQIQKLKFQTDIENYIGKPEIEFDSLDYFQRLLKDPLSKISDILFGFIFGVGILIVLPCYSIARRNNESLSDPKWIAIIAIGILLFIGICFLVSKLVKPSGKLAFHQNGLRFSNAAILYDDIKAIRPGTPANWIFNNFPSIFKTVVATNPSARRAYRESQDLSFSIVTHSEEEVGYLRMMDYYTDEDVRSFYSELQKYVPELEKREIVNWWTF